MRIRARAALMGLAALLAAGETLAQTSNPEQTPTQAAPPAQAQSPASQPAPQEKSSQPAPQEKYRSKDGELRANALIGATLYNDQKQTIGTISDLLIDKDNKIAKAVLSVGGFLGVGSRLVAVPFTDLKIEADRIVLPGATKVSLENLSAFQAGG
jgi:hypothetical protein